MSAGGFTVHCNDDVSSSVLYSEVSKTKSTKSVVVLSYRAATVDGFVVQLTGAMVPEHI